MKRPRRMLVCSFWAAVSVTIGCSGKKKAAPEPVVSKPDAGPDLFRCFPLEADDGICDPWDCGSNSPVIGTAAFDLKNGTDADWKIVKPDGVVPDHATIQKVASEPKTLTIDGGEIRADGVSIPEGETWWFIIRSEARKRECKVSVRRSDAVEPWYGNGSVPSYLFTVSERRGSDKKDLCSAKDWGKLKRSDKPGHRPGLFRGETPALVVFGERYTDRGDIVSGPTWFNLACAGSALAKMRLMGLDPETQPNDTRDRQTVLKLYTATYTREGESQQWTTDGVPLKLSRCSTSDDKCDLELEPDDPSYTSTVESYWAASGATCFKKTRLFSRQVLGPDDPDLPPKCRKRSGSEADCDALIRETCWPGEPKGTIEDCKSGSDTTYWKTEAVRYSKGATDR